MLPLMIAAGEHLFFTRGTAEQSRGEHDAEAGKSTDQRFNELSHEMIPDERSV